MEVWQIALYGGAAILALRCLVGLMTHHKRQFLEQLVEEERRRARAAKKQKALPTPPKTRSGRAA